jgi:hypothetical protein
LFNIEKMKTIFERKISDEILGRIVDTGGSIVLIDVRKVKPDLRFQIADPDNGICFLGCEYYWLLDVIKSHRSKSVLEYGRRIIEITQNSDFMIKITKADGTIKKLHQNLDEYSNFKKFIDEIEPILYDLGKKHGFDMAVDENKHFKSY